MSVRPRPAVDAGGALTLAAVIEAFQTAAADRLRPATLATYASHLRVHVVPNRGHIPLERLTGEHLRTLYQDLRAGGASVRTVQATHIALRQVTRFAVEQGWLDSDPMDGVRRPGGAKQAKVKPEQIRYWTAEELRRVLEAAHGVLSPQQALLFDVLAGTGCRISEALGLQFRDVRDNKLTFQRSWSKARKIEPMKSASSRRSVAASSKLVELIGAEQARRRAAVDDFIFDAGNGTPFDQDNVRRRLLAKVIRAAEVPTRSLHEIRHSHAVLLLEAGTPMKVVQLRLGHADAATTISTYAHVTPALEGAAVAALDGALGR